MLVIKSKKLKIVKNYCPDKGIINITHDFNFGPWSNNKSCSFVLITRTKGGLENFCKQSPEGGEWRVIRSQQTYSSLMCLKGVYHVYKRCYKDH